MTTLLCLAFFASGASALLFETLWFRETGLLLGNSVWATSLVTSSFMGGLAIGNALAASRSGRLRRPIASYAVLELAIAVTGVALVYALPNLGSIFAPVFGRLAEDPASLNALRLALAFALLLIPATAMGATLPLLTQALSARDAHFGRVLGRLYGWNTLGGVFGALVGEAWLIERLGLRGTGLVAGSLNLLAGWLALRVARGASEPTLAAPNPRGATAARGLVLAAVLCGGVALALEVLWFRLLLMFVYGTSLAFAVLLAVVLLGVAAGGLLAGSVLRRRPQAALFLPALALLAGTLTVWTYAASPESLALHGATPIATIGQIALPALALMFPTCALSGLLFTFLGAALRSRGREAAAASGTLALANTLGAMLGAPLAGFVLLPRLGVERSLFGLAAGYAIVAALTLDGDALRGPSGAGARVSLAVAALAFVGTLALFPFGLMQNRHVRVALAPWTADGSRVVAEREGLTETIAYLRRALLGETVSTRLVTNGFSMSSTNLSAERYMRLFVYLPVALRPEPKRALLISYGVGMTAKALADTRSLEAVDVVDISRDILELGRIVFPDGGFPLDDARFSVHVEDGRFFLLTTDQTLRPDHERAAAAEERRDREPLHARALHADPQAAWPRAGWRRTGCRSTRWNTTRRAPSRAPSATPSTTARSGPATGSSGCSPARRVAQGTGGEEAFTRAWHDPAVAPTLKRAGPRDPGAAGLVVSRRPGGAAALDRGRDAWSPTTTRCGFRRVARTPSTRAISSSWTRRGRASASRRAPGFGGSGPSELRTRTLASFDAQAQLNRPWVGARQAGSRASGTFRSC